MDEGRGGVAMSQAEIYDFWGLIASYQVFMICFWKNQDDVHIFHGERA